MEILSNSEIGRLSRLRRNKAAREESGRIVLFGFDEVKELGPRLKILRLFATDEKLFEGMPEAKKALCPIKRWSQLSGLEAKRGIGMEVAFSPLPLARPERLVVCDGISDPGNLGTIIRTARAFGYGGMVCTHGSADPFGDKALRASKGEALFMPMAKKFDFSGYTRVVADSRGAPVKKYTGPIACILGGEARGVSPEFFEGAEVVGIPMQNGVESLNVASAAAILLYLI